MASVETLRLIMSRPPRPRPFDPEPNPLDTGESFPMVKKKLKSPRELGYAAGLSGETLEQNEFVLSFNSTDQDEWKAGHAAGLARKAQYDAEDAPPETVVARVALDVAQAKAVAAPVDKLLLPIEADGYELAAAIATWSLAGSTSNLPASAQVLAGIGFPCKSNEETAVEFGRRFARGVLYFLGVS